VLLYGKQYSIEDKKRGDKNVTADKDTENRVTFYILLAHEIINVYIIWYGWVIEKKIYDVIEK